jgi:hypothetical protein
VFVCVRRPPECAGAPGTEFRETPTPHGELGYRACARETAPLPLAPGPVQRGTAVALVAAPSAAHMDVPVSLFKRRRVRVSA